MVVEELMTKKKFGNLKKHQINGKKKTWILLKKDYLGGN